MERIKIEIYGVMLMITGILYVSVFHPEDTKATILSGMDEPTGNAYEDLYVAEEENATYLLGINQTVNDNNTGIQSKWKDRKVTKESNSGTSNALTDRIIQVKNAHTNFWLE